MEWAGRIAGKLVTGAVVLAVLAGAISWYETSPVDRTQIIHSLGSLTGWAALVLALPWMLALVIARIAKLNSNAAGVALVGTLTVGEIALLLWFFHWSIHSRSGWMGMAACAVVAAAYNLFSCDWIAERFE